MKKWFLAFLFFFILIIACIYIFIPGKLIIENYAIANATANGSFRVLSDTGKWPKWWPGNNAISNSQSPSSFTLNNYHYTISEKLYNAIKVPISYKKSTFPSMIFILSLTPDSVVIKWKSTFSTSLNPVKRILQYQHAVHIKNNMIAILGHLQFFLNQNKNIYGLPIQQVIVKDSFLISEKKIISHYPNTSDAYGLINTLKLYMFKQGAKSTNYPMLNISPLNNDQFELRVAIPVNKELNNSNNIISKRLVTGGNMVTATVTGGPSVINKALSQMEVYIHDYQKTILAIPFESLVTDRLQNPDSTRWITQICYPIM